MGWPNDNDHEWIPRKMFKSWEQLRLYHAINFVAWYISVRFKLCVFSYHFHEVFLLLQLIIVSLFFSLTALSYFYFFNAKFRVSSVFLCGLNSN